VVGPLAFANRIMIYLEHEEMQRIALAHKRRSTLN